MFFERLQVEGVNGKRCQENIINDANEHTKINGQTMLDLCSTNDAKHKKKTTQTSKPKWSQQMTNNMQKCIPRANWFMGYVNSYKIVINAKL